MTTGFQLFREGHVAEAIEAYTRELEETRSALTMANRALARMSLGDYTGALYDYRAAEELQFTERPDRGDGYGKKIACVLWLMGREEEAIRMWEELLDALMSGGITFTDAAGGIQTGLLLWFSASLVRDEETARKALKFFEKQSKRPAIKNWPGPIAEYVLQRIDYRALMVAAQQQQTLVLRRGCQGVFYAGIKALLEGDQQLAGQMLKMAMDYGEDAALEIEYYLAGHEIKRGLLSSVAR